MKKLVPFVLMLVPLSVKSADPYHAHFDVDPVKFPFSQEAVIGIDINTEVGVRADSLGSPGRTYDAEAVVTHSSNQSTNATGYCYPTPSTYMTCIIWSNVTINGSLLYTLRLDVDFESNGAITVFDSGYEPFYKHPDLVRLDGLNEQTTENSF